jgi:SecD/SecF fusion protein
VLGGTDIKNPEQSFEDGTGGRRSSRWSSATRAARRSPRRPREIAQRAPTTRPRTAACRTRSDASHHFAIRLDNELISTPYINFRENPDGIDGSQGAQISGGFTIQTAQDLARLLKIGALPLSSELISRSQVSATLGQQALDQGLVAASRASPIVALFLLSFYRVLGAIAWSRCASTRSTCSR